MPHLTRFIGHGEGNRPTSVNIFHFSSKRWGGVVWQALMPGHGMSVSLDNHDLPKAADHATASKIRGREGD
jgi:hypothetical protein